MSYWIGTQDNSAVYEVFDMGLRSYFRDKQVLKYSPFLCTTYLGYNGPIHVAMGEVLPPFLPEEWRLEDVIAYQEAYLPTRDGLQVGRILLHLFRADPLRYPCKQSEVETYGLLYQVRNRLTRQILSKTLLKETEDSLDAIFGSQDALSSLFYVQELVLVQRTCCISLQVTLETRLSTGFSADQLCVYYYPDWMISKLVAFVTRHEFPRFSPDYDLALYKEKDGRLEYLSGVSILKSCYESDAIYSIALSVPRVKIRLPLQPSTLTAVFFVKVIHEKGCQDTACLALTKSLDKQVRRQSYRAKLYQDALIFYDVEEKEEGDETILWRLRHLDKLNVVQEGSQTLLLTKHPLSCGRVCPAGLYLTFSMDCLSKRGKELWEERLSMAKQVRLLDPIDTKLDDTLSSKLDTISRFSYLEADVEDIDGNDANTIIFSP
jgi:hypothetical protein